MSVKIFLHPDLSYLTGNMESVETEGRTVGECLTELVARYPALHDLIFYKDGKLQTFIGIYVNGKVPGPNELDWKVQDGDEIHLMMIIAGG